MSDTLMDFNGAVHHYDPVLGLEVHVELGAVTKMFGATPNIFSTQPNTMVTPTSVGLPDALPAVSTRGVKYAIRIGLTPGCETAQSCRFARKNYFCPDLAKDFQISQSDESIVYNSVLEIEMRDGSFFTIPIKRAHMEEDAGKNTHIGGADGRIEGANHSPVDYNRAGVPLVEIVTHPIEGTSARAPRVTAVYIRTLCDIFRTPGVSKARMEHGNVRADVNVSLRGSPDVPLGTRTEAKNVNTFREIEQIVRYETQRQAAILAAGGETSQETRHGQADGTTRAGRIKSGADDYHYFPEPDLVPMTPSREWVEEIHAGLPRVPAAERRHLKAEQGLNNTEIRDIVNAGMLELIETTAVAGVTGQAARKWWMGELSRTTREQETALENMTVTPKQIAELQGMVDSDRLTDKLVRQVLEGVLTGEGDSGAVAATHGLEIVSGGSALLAAVDEALTANPDVVDKIYDGRVQAADAVVGAVIRATRGRADAKRVRELVMERVQD